MTEFAEPEVQVFDARARRARHDRKVVEGKDDWLFLDNDVAQVVDQHRGLLLLSDEQLDRWCEGLERRAARMRSAGVPYAFVIVPDKHAVYPEKLPDTIVPGPVRPVIQLLDGLRSRQAGVHVIYPIERLMQAKQRQLVFSSTDTHCNAHGALTVYEQLVEELEPSVALRRAGPGDIRIRERFTAGELGLKVEPERKSEYAYFDTRHRESRFQRNNGVGGFGRITEFACPEAPDSTAVVFGDSAAARLSTPLAESFGRLVLKYASQVDYELVAREQPDVVLSVMTERRMMDPRALPQD